MSQCSGSGLYEETSFKEARRPREKKEVVDDPCVVVNHGRHRAMNGRSRLGVEELIRRDRSEDLAEPDEQVLRARSGTGGAHRHVSDSRTGNSY
eukprot:6196170-Pleurochrysis_carterae.AAC.2